MPREKYVFLVRHAQSTWNQNVEMVKTFRSLALDDISIKDVVSRASHLMASDLWHKDHPISEQGVRQTEALRRKIAAVRQGGPAACQAQPRSDEGCSPSSSSRESPTRRALLQAEREREQRYYDRFLMQRQQIYCSPLLRALQTAHLALPAEDGWPSIKLLKDARERFSLRIERDCVGCSGAVGKHIISRAMRMGQELPGIEGRVDASDCAQQWWSDEPETEADLEVRLKSLWRRLLDEDRDDSCVLVTHSNLIKALMMHFGGVDVGENEQASGELHSDQLHSDLRSRGHGGYSASPRAGCCKEASRGLAAAVEGSITGEEPPVDLGKSEPCPYDNRPEDCEIGDPWQVVARSSDALRPLKTERLQNCGVLGLRCVLESPVQRLYPEVDGWIDLDEPHHETAPPCLSNWVARDALLMFDSVLVN